MYDTMKKILFLLCLLPSLLWAQDDAKYLAGAVPVEDGYVTFRQTFKAPSLSQKELYQALLMWANDKFQPTDQFPQNKLITQDEANGELGAIGEEYLVFSSSLLSLDRTRIYYQCRVECGAGEVCPSSLFLQQDGRRFAGGGSAVPDLRREIFQDQHFAVHSVGACADVLGQCHG